MILIILLNVLIFLNAERLGGKYFSQKVYDEVLNLPKRVILNQPDNEIDIFFKNKKEFKPIFYTEMGEKIMNSTGRIADFRNNQTIIEFPVNEKMNFYLLIKNNGISAVAYKSFLDYVKILNYDFNSDENYAKYVVLKVVFNVENRLKTFHIYLPRKINNTPNLIYSLPLIRNPKFPQFRKFLNFWIYPFDNQTILEIIQHDFTARFMETSYHDKERSINQSIFLSLNDFKKIIYHFIIDQKQYSSWVTDDGHFRINTKHHFGEHPLFVISQFIINKGRDLWLLQTVLTFNLEEFMHLAYFASGIVHDFEYGIQEPVKLDVDYTDLMIKVPISENF